MKIRFQEEQAFGATAFHGTSAGFAGITSSPLQKERKISTYDEVHRSFLGSQLPFTSQKSIFSRCLVSGTVLSSSLVPLWFRWELLLPFRMVNRRCASFDPVLNPNTAEEVGNGALTKIK